jgi:hypothetical protein
MKTLVFILFALPYIALGQCDPLGNGILKAEVDGNSVILKNDSIYRNCAVSYLMEITKIEGDTLVWFQLEQNMESLLCECYFNLSITLDSLEAGNYYVKTYYTNIPFPVGDTCDVGLISFTISEQNSFVSYDVSYPYQSSCVTVGTNTMDQSKTENLTINPNPAKDIITISSPLITENTNLSVCNVSGEKVMERQLTEKEAQLDISALPRGVYFVRVQNEKMVEVEKMVKE